MQRRDFLTAGGLTILRSGMLRGQKAPSNRLNIALVGVWGRGTAHYNVLRSENVVALCDVNDLRTREAAAAFPKAKTYWDWRRMLDQNDIDAVMICSADHHHAFIANYLKNRGKIATQHGTQRHAYPNFERVRELILDGAVGDLKTIHGWDSRQLPRPGYPRGEGAAPPTCITSSGSAPRRSIPTALNTSAAPAG